MSEWCKYSVKEYDALVIIALLQGHLITISDYSPENPVYLRVVREAIRHVKHVKKEALSSSANGDTQNYLLNTKRVRLLNSDALGTSLCAKQLKIGHGMILVIMFII